MSEKRFFTKINKNGRNVIIDKECNIELIDLTLACDVLNRLDLKLKHYNEVNGEQQSDLIYLAKFIGEFKVEEFKLKLRNLRILEDKVLEQQATIQLLTKRRDRWRELSNSFSAYCNCYEKAIERAFEEKPSPSVEDIYRIYAELEKELENE